MSVLGQTVVNGLEMGSFYALVALGLSLIFGVMKVVNFAHGEFYMIGAYITYYLSVVAGIPYFFSFVLTLAMMFALGFGIEKAVIRPVRHNMMAGFILTLGLSIFLMNLGFRVFGLIGKGIPTVFPGLIILDGVQTSVERVVTSSIAVAFICALIYLLYRTRLGRAFRATAQDSEAAQLQGVNIGHISSLSLAISLALVGAAGALIATIFTVEPSMGMKPCALAFVIIVVGGLGNIRGAIVASILVGLIESFISAYIGPVYSWGIVFLMAFLVIALRPKGLFGRA